MLYDDLDRLKDIQTEMLELLSEAEHLIRQSPDRIVHERARRYWLAQVKIGLTDEHDYIGQSMCSMESTIGELEEILEGEDDDEWPED